MGLKHRLARLEKDAGGRTCCCPVEWIEVRDGEPDPTEAIPPAPGSGNAAGRAVCGKCGLPVEPGRIRFIVIRLAVQIADESDP